MISFNNGRYNRTYIISIYDVGAHILINYNITLCASAVFRVEVYFELLQTLISLHYNVLYNFVCEQLEKKEKEKDKTSMLLDQYQ